MRPLRFGLVLALLHTACGRPPEEWRIGDPGRFIDARLFSDGTAGLISFHRALPVAAEYAAGAGAAGFFWGGSRPGTPLPSGLVSDRNFIGLYDLTTSTLRVLVTRDNTERLLDQGTLQISDLEGATALILETGNLRYDAREIISLYLLDTKNPRLIPLPIQKELSQRGMAAVRLDLVNADGTLAMVVKHTSHTGLGGYGNGIVVRYPSGEYVQLSESARYRESAHYRDRWPPGDEVIYELDPGNGIKAFDIRTRTVREIRRYPSAWRASSPVYWRVHDDDTVRIVTETESGAPIISAPLPIDTDAMK